MHMGDTVCFSEFGPLTVEITTLRLVLRRGFVIFEYVSGDYNVCLRERGESRSPCLSYVLRLMVRKRERWKKKEPLV